MKTNMERKQIVNKNTEKNACLKQMRGRILLSSTITNNGNYRWKWGDSAYILSGIRPGEEYQLSMTLMGLRNINGFLNCVINNININVNKKSSVAKAAVHILHHLEQHKKNINEIWLLPKAYDAKCCMDAYIIAFAGALDVGAKGLFLSLDGKRLAHALACNPNITSQIFSMLPFFEDTEYIYHIMSNWRMSSIFEQIMPESLSTEEKQMLGSRKFLASRILPGVRKTIIKNAISVCAKNQESFRFLQYVAATFPRGTWDSAVHNSEKIEDAELCIQVLERLKGSLNRQMQAFRLMDDVEYNKKFINILLKKSRKIQSSTFPQLKGYLPAW